LLPLLIDAQHLDFARGGGSAALAAPPPRQLANTPAASVDCSNCIDFIHELAIASHSIVSSGNAYRNLQEVHFEKHFI
jgi:hypothetical protein